MTPDVPRDDAQRILDRVRERGGRATIYDIAELAGVNPSTVSRALGKPGRISEATAARVRAAAEALDFHVNPMARALQTGRTGVLGLVVADITNPVVFGMLRGAEREAASRGYMLVTAESQESGETEAETVQRLLPAVDGVILATPRLDSASITRFAQRTPLVLINRALDGVTCVLPDVQTGAEQLIGHLAGLGHTAIAFLAGPATSWISAQRWEAVFAAAERRHVGIVEVATSEPTLSGGREALRRVLAARVTAAVAYNDLIAIGLMHAASAAGIAVPRQLSVAGFDDIFASEMVTPALTTVRTDLETAGRRAVAAVLDGTGAASADAAPADAAPPAPIATELVIRASTAAVA